jgi:hypothetical protein
MKLFSKTLTIIKKSAHKILWLERLVLNFKRKINRRKKVFYSNILGLFQNKHGLEIGGPSKIFNPIYDISNSIDGVNHGETIWQGTVVKGAYNGTGKQYIAEGTELIPELLNNKYDFVMASHVLEHIANPLKAIHTWGKSIVKFGLLVLILPKKEHTFDHKRSVTSIHTLIEKYKLNIGEDDLSELDEILKLHDLSMDTAAGSKEKLLERSLKNYENRCLHHHVFDFKLLHKVAKEVRMKVIYESLQGMDQFIIFQKMY